LSLFKSDPAENGFTFCDKTAETEIFLQKPGDW
jgi:hypothetical protein